MTFDLLARDAALLAADESGLVLNKKINEFVSRTQRIVEGANFSMREYNLKLDDVINEQRNVIYHIRNAVLEKADRIQVVFPMAEAS